MSNEQKNRLRKQILALRNALPPEVRARKSRDICRMFLHECMPKEWIADVREGSPRSILCAYLPFRSEVDIRPLIEWCWRERVQVAVPRVNMESRDFQLYFIRGYGDLEQGAWGIPEPKVSVCARLDDLSRIRAILAPGVAFDRRGGRIGYGGGFYDRFMSRFRELNLEFPVIWAVAFDFQIVDEVPMEAHDFRVDRIVTDQGAVAMER